jgi:serine/threonine protein kinase
VVVFDLAYTKKLTFFSNPKTCVHSGGSNRIVFSAQMPTGEPVIFKECPMKKPHTLGEKSLELMRLDGAVGANLQPHPRFVKIFSWCALSMFSEHMKNGDLVQYATPKFDRCDRFDVSKKYSNLTVSTKLRWSLQMAEAIAVLHNNPGGVFVHNDIWLAQFLVSDDGQNIKINDFNLGEIMHWNQEKGEYCKYRRVSDLSFPLVSFRLVIHQVAIIQLTLMCLYRFGMQRVSIMEM